MLHLLLSPLSLGIGGVCAWAWAARTPAPRKGVRRAVMALGALATVTAAGLSSPWGANALVAGLERDLGGAPRCGEADTSRPVVVLSGGFDREPRDADDVEALSRASLKRLLAALAAAGATTGNGPALVISGGAPEGSGISEAQVMAGWARRSGWPADRLLTETASKNTWENAQALAALKPALPREIRLVTSAMHLPRAVAALRRHGFEVCAVPADPLWVGPGGWGYYVPQSSAVVKAERALHEWVGLTVQRWRHGDAAARPAS